MPKSPGPGPPLGRAALSRQTEPCEDKASQGLPVQTRGVPDVVRPGLKQTAREIGRRMVPFNEILYFFHLPHPGPAPPRHQPLGLPPCLRPSQKAELFLFFSASLSEAGQNLSMLFLILRLPYSFQSLPRALWPLVQCLTALQCEPGLCNLSSSLLLWAAADIYSFSAWGFLLNSGKCP